MNLTTVVFPSILHLDVPAGSYVVTAMVAASNDGSTNEPVLCALTSSVNNNLAGTSVTASQQLESFPGASSVTIPVSFATTLGSSGRIDLDCFVNDGPGVSPAVSAQQMSITAVRVGSLHVQSAN